MKTFLGVVWVIGLSAVYGLIGFVAGVASWVAVAMAQEDVRKEEERMRRKWRGEYK